MPLRGMRAWLATWGLAVVRGRSMQPTLYDGDRLLVRHGAAPREGAWSSYACRTGWSP